MALPLPLPPRYPKPETRNPNHPGTIGIPPLRAGNKDSDGASVGMTKVRLNYPPSSSQRFCWSDRNEARPSVIPTITRLPSEAEESRWFCLRFCLCLPDTPNPKPETRTIQFRKSGYGAAGLLPGRVTGCTSG